jgi:hypothetical protein
MLLCTLHVQPGSHNISIEDYADKSIGKIHKISYNAQKRNISLCVMYIEKAKEC